MTDEPEEKREPRYKRRPRGPRKSKIGLQSQKDRTKRRRRELKEMNVHLPKTRITAQDVKTIKALKDALRETWEGVWERIGDFTHFTERQMQFARQYAINGRRNKSQAVRLAGFQRADPNHQLKMANDMLKMPFMDDLISVFELEEKAKMRINVEDVVKWFNDIATKAMEAEDFTNANRAMENLAKYLGMFVERKEITHKTVHSREELDARIAELTAVLKEAEPDIERKLRIN